jgi:hypothetical protein
MGHQVFVAVHVDRTEETRNKYIILLRKPLGGCNLKHHERYNIQMDTDVLKNCVRATEM